MRAGSMGTSRRFTRVAAVILATAVAITGIADTTAFAAKKNKKPNKKAETEEVTEEVTEQVAIPEEPEDKFVVLKSVNDAFTAMTVDYLVDGTEDVFDLITVMSKKLKLETEDEFGNKYTRRQRKWLKKAMVSGDCVEVYEEDSKKSEVVGYMYSTSVATVLSAGDKWTYIKSGNVKGYVKTGKCVFGVDALERCKEVETEVATVEVGAVNIRSKAEVNTKIVASAKKGDEFLYFDTIDNWAHIMTVSGTEGYIDGAYVSIGSNIGTAYTVEEAEAGFVFTKEVVEEKKAEAEKRADEERLQELKLQSEEAIAKAKERAKAKAEDGFSEYEALENTEDSETESAEDAEVTEDETESDVDPDLEITTDIITVYNDPIEIEDEELTLLAALIQCEAGGEPYIGQVAVGAVVLNRMRSGSFPDDVAGVIYDEGQFSPVDNGMLEARLEEGNILQSCYDAAEEALMGVDPTDGCLFFQRAGKRSGLLISNHIFFKVY